MDRSAKYLTVFLVVFALIAWGIFLYFIGPQKIVEFLGYQNSYIAAFIIALIGGTSVFTTASFYATIATLAAGGLNIFILALIAGIGAALGDSFFFFLGLKGRNMASPSFGKKLDKFSRWLHRLPDWIIPFFVFIYAGFIPLPNDVMMVSLALGKYKFRKIIPFVILGDIVLMLAISFLAREGIDWIK
jgi:membrane protein YqaA with SNARE-associated domain